MRGKFLAQALILILLANTMSGCAIKRWWNHHFGPKTPAGVGQLGSGTEIPPGERPMITGEGDHRTFEAQMVFFDYDSAKIKPSEFSKIEKVASQLKGNSMKVVVEGHTDERGTAEYNRSLGERRAQAAREELIHLGVDGSRLTTVSYGRERPLDPSHGDTAWSRNRRAEFVVVGQ